jgi:putative membrane protein
MLKKSKLILCLDRDNDIYNKASITGPIIGREANFNAAVSLALIDPTDVDSNAIFKAISIYDKLKKEDQDVEIVTLTGSTQLGYVADEEIANQLDKILSEKKFDSCILVTDGQSDQAALPIIQSRIKIDGVEFVVMKQAQELEKTYFVILEKLKEPYYARLIFGIPALLGIIFVLSKFLNWGIEVPIFLISFYLFLKAFGIEDKLLKYLSEFRFSLDKLSLIFYLPAFLFVFISIFTAYNSFISSISNMETLALSIAKGFRSFLSLFPFAVLLFLTGKVVDFITENKKIEIIRYSSYAVFIVLLWMVFSAGIAWIINDTPPYIDFKSLIFIVLLAGLGGYFSNILFSKMRKNVALKLRVSGKEVIGINGNYIGKVVGIEPNLGALAVKSFFGEKILLPIDLIEQIGESKIIVNYK